MRIVVAGLIIGAVISPLAAQTVEVQVRESPSRAPVAGAIVRLIGSTGVQAQALSNTQGRVVLTGSGGGQYRIKVDRIGWSGLLTDPFDLVAGQSLQREVMMASHPIELPPVVVTGKSACNLDGAGPFTALLWEEIRKALTANVLTQRQGGLPLHVREFKRELDLRGRTLREWATGSSVARGRPYQALPPTLLAQVGFVQASEDSSTYAAPDAELLLSDAFVSTHCFRAVAAVSGLVGLEFIPIPRRELSDVRGTLWVDRAGGELKFLEYTYTGLPRELAGVGLGGRVEFLRLATGAWIISYWYIRMPRVEPPVMEDRKRQPRPAVLAGFLDRGGRAELAGNSAGVINRAILTGRIFDSTVGRGLADAVVRLEGSRDSVYTDGEGRFELAVPRSGDQVVIAAHPKLGLLRDDPKLPVLLSIGDTTRADFAVPSAATFAREYCGSSKRTGLIGQIQREDGGSVEDLVVSVKWLSSGGAREERDRSGPRGTFAICSLVAGPTLPVRVQNRFRVLLEERLQLAPGEYRWVDLRLPRERP